MNEPHPLSAWIERNTTQAKFAADNGCSESHLSLILQGKRGTSLKLAQRFSRSTGGVVPVEAFVKPEVAA